MKLRIKELDLELSNSFELVIIGLIVIIVVALMV
jgi:hypothetical protein